MQGQHKTSNCVGKCRQTVTGRYAAGLLCPNEVGFLGVAFSIWVAIACIVVFFRFLDSQLGQDKLEIKNSPREKKPPKELKLAELLSVRLLEQKTRSGRGTLIMVTLEGSKRVSHTFGHSSMEPLNELRLRVWFMWGLRNRAESARVVRTSSFNDVSERVHLGW